MTGHLWLSTFDQRHGAGTAKVVLLMSPVFLSMLLVLALEPGNYDFSPIYYGTCLYNGSLKKSIAIDTDTAMRLILTSVGYIYIHFLGFIHAYTDTHAHAHTGKHTGVHIHTHKHMI